MLEALGNLVPRIEFLAQALFRRQRACPFCAPGDTAVVARKYGLVRIRKCNRCGLYFTDPIYRTMLASNLYDGLYRAEGSTTALPGDAELERLKEISFCGTDKDFADRVRIIGEMAGGAALLEIGSSWGYFLFQARSAGIDAVGIEIGDGRRRFGVERLGVPIVKDMAELGSRKFGVVYTSHTLEHFTDLSMIFGQIREVLVPGGLLFIEVPNFDFERRGKDILKIIGAVHPLGLTPDFFRRALPSSGFRVIGSFDGWDAIPSRSSDDVLSPCFILLAERLRPTVEVS